jgi:hypothetical protein
MHIEWFIKEQLRQLEQQGRRLLELLPIEKTINPPGKLRYCSTCYSIYFSDTHVFVDSTVFFSNGTMVLRATCEYDGDPVTEVFWGCYGILSIFLKAMFLHGIETGIDYNNHCDTIRLDTVAVLRHFNPWVVDKNQRGGQFTYCTDLVAGWCASYLADRPLALSYVVNENDGRIAFSEPGGTPPDQQVGWICLNVAPFQSLSPAVIDERDPSSIFAKTNLELLYRAGCGNKVLMWEPAHLDSAIPTLSMLVK